MSVKVEIRGGKELFEAMNRLPEDAAKKIIRSGLKQSAEIWREEMANTVAVGPSKLGYGFLRDHIGIKVSTRGDELQGTAAVFPVKKGFWSLFLEFGTSKMPAQPFIRRAFEARKNDVLDKFVSVCREKLKAIGLR